MKLHISPSCRWLLLIFCLLLPHLTATAQTVLLTESFEGGSGTTPPPGWTTEQVSGTAGQVSFLPTGTHPTVTPFDGSRLVEFNSWTAPSGNFTRLKRTISLSTVGYLAISVDFAWLEDNAYPSNYDSLIVEWSTNGTTWEMAGMVGRYNTVSGWKIKSIPLPSLTAGQPALYVAFVFMSDYGNNCHLDLVHINGVMLLPNTGILTGQVKNCFNNQPLSGATVTCGALTTTSNPTGYYTLLNVPIGSQQVSCSAPSFLTQQKTVNVVNQQTTTQNFCMDPTPAYLSGIVTNAHSGNPIVGARIQVGNAVTYSTGGGQYTLNIYPPGAFSVTANKLGFDSYAAGPFIFQIGVTESLNIAMPPSNYPPGPGTAILNGTQTAVDLSWQFPSGSYEILYDDGIQDNFTVWAQAGSKNAVKFSPVGYPCTIFGGKVHIGTADDYTPGAPGLVPFQMAVYDASGPGGLPGNQVGELIDVTPSNYGWVDFVFPPTVITSGNFYLVRIQGGNAPNASGIAVDETTPQLRSYNWSATTGGPWVPANGNFMVRAFVEGEGGPLPPLDGMPPETTSTGTGNDPETITGYHFWRLKQGEESNPAVWTSIGTSSSPTFTDNTWSSLPCSPYLWACKVDYMGQLSTSTFTNVIGKCWTAGITVYTANCCEEDTINPHPPAMLTNVSYPDTIYLIQPDSSGYAFIPNVWFGSYMLECYTFNCNPYTLLLDITGDDSIQVIPTGPVPNPPGFVFVDDKSLEGQWYYPLDLQNLFNEDWSNGYGPNQWIETPANSNWQINTTFGNPSPSATFTSTPTLTNYEQYLASNQIIHGLNSPFLILKYDIYLSNFGTTTTENMAIEIWDGSAWTQVKNWNNQWGSISWTCDQLDISQYTDDDIQIRFKAWGADSYNINNWNIDNIQVIAGGTSLSPPQCFLGYNIELNNVLIAFTTDTSYLIPPNLVQYGQTYDFCVNSVYTSGYSNQVCYTFTSHFLYPVRNVTATPLECAADVSWDKPLDIGTGVTPIGLIGYKIYRWHNFHHYIQDPDSTTFLDTNLNPGLYNYDVTAIFDITYYGFPGQQDESLLERAPVIQVACGPILPFGEGWNSGTFTYNEWSFEPDQGNWNISMSDEGTAPYADFSWEPIQTNYHFELISRAIDATPWDCADIWLDVEVKLVDRFATGTEHLRIDLYCDNYWTTLYTLSNTGSFDWTTLHLNIGQVSGKGFMIRFVAEGENSSNILHWLIDNISMYGECIAPLNLDLMVNGQFVDLFWDAPPCNDLSGLAGYMLYRSDSSGAAPYVPVTSTPITGTNYSDDPGLPGTFRYFVTAKFINAQTGDSLCESVGTDTVTALVVGYQYPDAGKLVVYPNPAGNRLYLESANPITRIELYSLLGDRCLTEDNLSASTLSLDLSSLKQGIYMLKVTTNGAVYQRKIVISR
ncbi:MAG: carboxypeptidase regulatory-like domain-containing protein [Bacteroidales bacterium]|nr:carboxypeptidase regulatory-like domain-containing protein [Bacteroidales bacterium]